MICLIIIIYWTNCPMIMIYWPSFSMIINNLTNCPMSKGAFGGNWIKHKNAHILVAFCRNNNICASSNKFGKEKPFPALFYETL